MLTRIKHYVLVLCLTALTFGISHAGSELERATDKQKQTLQKAFDYGLNKELVNSELEHLGYIFASIAWVESRAGANTGINKKGHKSYGVFQNYVYTVKTRMERSPNYPDKVTTDYVKDRLSKDFKESAKFAYIELQTWDKVRKGNISNILASYNAGYKMELGVGYSAKVLKQAKYFKDNDYFGYESLKNKDTTCQQVLQSLKLSTSSSVSHQKLKNVCIVLTQNDYLSSVVSRLQASMNTLKMPN